MDQTFNQTSRYSDEELTRAANSTVRARWSATKAATSSVPKRSTARSSMPPMAIRIGHISHLMIGKRSGRVEYAVMSFGGFLGMGEKLPPAALGRARL
jgi:hypothetical protein